MKVDNKNDAGLVDRYGVCIIGAGPAGLATLSALRSPYSRDTLTDHEIVQADRRSSPSTSQQRCDKQKICVVDPQDWLQGWSSKFDALNIGFLRSPTIAHPDMFDSTALLAYAQMQGRHREELFESGCTEMTKLLSQGGQSQTQSGLWALPSTELFQDFCLDLIKSLPHDFIRSTVSDIDDDVQSLNNDEEDEEEDDIQSSFRVHLASGQTIIANSVVLALGTVGKPIIPGFLSSTNTNASISMPPPSCVMQWYDPFPPNLATCKCQNKIQSVHVLVIGGGLTAVQTAQKWARWVGDNAGGRVTLCSRRPLVERHFDLGVEWFDRRTSTKCMSDFYHQPVMDRLEMIKSTRGGGSVPPIYMRDVERLEKMGTLKRIVGEATSCIQKNKDGPAEVTINGVSYSFDLIVLACGVQPDCSSHPLLAEVLNRWPLPVHGGFPCVTEDVEWRSKTNLFVTGSLASLNLGPDAGNLMGARRAAQLIAGRLGRPSWLREEGNILAQNRFDSLLWSDSEDDDSSDEE